MIKSKTSVFTAESNREKKSTNSANERQEKNKIVKILFSISCEWKHL